MQDYKLFDMIKEDRPEEDRQTCATLVNALTGLVAILAALVKPYMPTTTDKVHLGMRCPLAYRPMCECQ